MASSGGKKKMLELFDNDYLFMEKLRIGQRNSKENFAGHYPNVDLTFSKTQFTKTKFETEPFIEDLDASAHLKYQHINDYRHLTQTQRSMGKKMANNSFRQSLEEIYN